MKGKISVERFNMRGKQTEESANLKTGQLRYVPIRT